MQPLHKVLWGILRVDQSTSTFLLLRALAQNKHTNWSDQFLLLEVTNCHHRFRFRIAAYDATYQQTRLVNQAIYRALPAEICHFISYLGQRRGYSAGLDRQQNVELH